MQAGDIALLNMLQPDGSKKNRPVLLLKKVLPFNDWIVCAVSSQIHQEVVGFDYKILNSDQIFSTTGLKQSSIIRLGMISTVATSSILGIIGNIPATTLDTLKKRLANHIAA